MCRAKSAAAKSGSTRSLRREEAMSDMWRDQGVGSDEACWYIMVPVGNGWRALRAEHNDFLYLPAVAAAMVAILPPTSITKPVGWV
jgi:hypothetical protein